MRRKNRSWQAVAVAAVVWLAWAEEGRAQTPDEAGAQPEPPIRLPPGAMTRSEMRRQRRERRAQQLKQQMEGNQNTPTVSPVSPPTAEAPAPLPTPPPLTPPPAATTTTPAAADAPGEKEFNSCRKFPAGKRVVKLNLKPDTELGDLLSWISSITCKQFLLPGTIPANSKKVTVIAPQLITPEEAYRLFLAALDSVGLTVQPSGKFLRIIETLKAKTASIPVYGPDNEVPQSESYVTRLVRVENADVNEMAQVLGRLKGEQGDVVVYAPQGALVITDLASNINRMLKIMREIDQPGMGEKIGRAHV